SEAKRHHHMARLVVALLLEKTAGLAAPQVYPDLVTAQRAQRVGQVANVEADREIVDHRLGFDFFLGFFLLGIVRNDLDAARRQLELYATVLLVRQDRGALQGALQHVTLDRRRLVCTERNHGLVVRETTVDELGREDHPTTTHAEMVATALQFDHALTGFEQTDQLIHALSGNDDLATSRNRAFQLGFLQRQAVTVGSDATQRVLLEIQQHAVEVIADVLVRHGESRAIHQIAQD